MATTLIDGGRQIKSSSITNTQQNFGTPSASTDVAIKSYVDSVAQGLDIKPSARVATVAVLSPANTYANGASGVGATLTATGVGILTVDGVNTVINDYILVKNQASGLQNGLYKVTTEGTAGVAYILTRAVEMDTTLEFSGGFIFIEAGSTLASTGWVCNTAPAPTVGTTAITFTQFSGTGTYTNGNGLTLTGTAFSIDTTITADLTTAQTLTNKTLTSPKLNENVAVTTTATKLNYLTSATGTTGTASTNIVFSTSPVLTTPNIGVATATSVSTSAAIPLLMTNGQLVNVALTSQTIGATTLTIPDFASVVDEFTFKTKAQTMSNKTFIAPVLGAATATSINGNTFTTGTYTLTGTAAKTLNFTNSLTLSGTDTTTMTFPTTSATIARTDAANTFTGVQTFSTPIATGSVATMTATVGGGVPTPPNNTTTFLRGDGTFAAVTSSKYFRADAISGTQNSSNKVFTLTSAVDTGSEQIFLNGQLLTPGSGNDYTIASTTVTLEAGFTAPAAADTLRAYGNY